MAYRPKKSDPYQPRLTVGGDLIAYPGDCGTPTVDLLTVNGWGAAVTWVGNEVASNGESGSVWIGFFGAVSHYNSALCDVFTLLSWDVGFVYEVDGVGSFRLSWNSLGKTSQFFAVGCRV